ncbi:SEL1-like repeat protein [Pseudomonas sp. RL_105y_Pfl2_101]|uniref:SEL1-like repeat protein n=1 Tax=Pseudomonas sp. RL_105y_Pfl2_101 TaxID=3088708 RepID=UPI0030DCF2CF
MRLFLLLPCLLLVACGSDGSFYFPKKDPSVKPLTEIKAKLAFTCKHETIPAPSAESDVLFQYGRWLQKNNQLKQDRTVDTEIERLYRIAAENGHFKANINLQNGAMRGHFELSGAQHLRMSQQLIDAGVATGYYFVGIFLQQGSAGLHQDPEMSLRYFRKAADQGSAQAQYLVGDKLDPIDVAPEIATQMYHCATEQGQGKAAVALGIDHQHKGQYRQALEVLQMGTAAGNENAAGRLEEAFRAPPITNELYYLGQQEDLERAERYKKIWQILANYSYANPTVPEINDILPLPPAELPEWDGKLQWLEARLANVPPQKPSEALIRELAEAKGLEPATGKPTPDSPAFIRAEQPSTTCQSGQACTQTGYWIAAGYAVIRRFEEGQALPTLNVRHREYRFLLPDRVTVGPEKVDWIFYG